MSEKFVSARFFILTLSAGFNYYVTRNSYCYCDFTRMVSSLANESEHEKRRKILKTFRCYKRITVDINDFDTFTIFFILVLGK